MTEKLRTVVIFCEDRFRIECRHQLGKLECAKIVHEIPHSLEEFGTEIWEEIARLEPQVLFLELDKDNGINLRLLDSLHSAFPAVPVLGAGDSADSDFLIEALRLGVKEILPRPLNFNSLSEAYLRINKQNYGDVGDKQPAPIFSFFSCKGGSGCTTIATNFAVSLSRVSKKKVLVLDLDLEFGDVSAFFGIKTEKFLVTRGNEPDSIDAKRLSRSVVTHATTGIDILSFCDALPQNPAHLASEIKPMLGVLQREYDFIVVDTSSKLNDLIVATLDCSHLIFLISKCSLPALWNAQRVLHGFEKLGYSSSRIRVLLNRYLKDEGVSLKEVEKALGFDVFWSLPNDYKSIIRSIQCGEPLTWQNNSIPLAKSFYDLSAEVLGIKLEGQPKPAGGLLLRPKESQAKSLPLTTLNLLKS